MKKIWHPYWTWEDVGMWRKATREDEILLLPKAIEFMGNVALYGEWMLKVIEQYEYACQHNLTDVSLNQRAWIGHAACHMALDAPEYITRQAWGLLSDEQRFDANAKADIAINLWKIDNEKPNWEIRRKMGTEGVQKWNTRRISAKFGIIGKSSVISNDMPSNPQKRFEFC
jgi:hypothetical protein